MRAPGPRKLRGGRLRDEFLNETLFSSLAQARVALEEWRRDYNEVRPHSRIGWLAPAVYATTFKTQTGQGTALWPRPSRLGPLRQNHMRILTAKLQPKSDKTWGQRQGQ